jgi:hypothetical protein
MANFGGVLVDYDHFSLDRDKTSEAAGWILNVEHRPGLGLWGKIRWTDTGEAAIRGGRYRYISPVWRQDECDTLDGGKVRPRRLTNAAVTNSPNLFGMIPLSNTVRVSPAAAALLANRVLANALQAGNERQRRAFWARLRGSPAAAASRETPTATAPVTYPDLPENTIGVPGRTFLPPKGQNGAYPMPIVGPGNGRTRPPTGKPGDIFTGGSERFDERLGRYLTDAELAAKRAGVFREPKTADQLDADSARASVEHDRNRELQKIIARRKAIEKSQAADNAKPKPWESAEAGRKAAGVGVAKAAGPRQVGGAGDAAKSKGRGRPKALDLPADVRILFGSREPGLQRTAGALRPQTYQGAIRTRGRSATTLSDQINADRARIRRTLGNRSAMTDDQRRAMFAKLRSGGGGWSDPPTTGGDTPAAQPEPAVPTAGAPALDYRSTTRDFDARIELLQKERARLSAAEPRPPEGHDFDTIDTRALRDELLRQGKPLNDVTAAVREAEAHNAAVREATDAILTDLKARGVPASKREAALAAELEKIGKADDKARADYDRAMLRHREKLAAIDRDIEEEEIRKAEAGEKTQQTAGNAAVREAVAADKARAAAEAAAAKKAEADAAKAAAATGKAKPVDPVAENRLIKARNRAYAEAIIRGDLDLADRLAPGVDHKSNAAAVARLMPSKAELNSPRNQKVMADVIRSLEGTNPHAYPRR